MRDEWLNDPHVSPFLQRGTAADAKEGIFGIYSSYTIMEEESGAKCYFFQFLIPV